MLGTKFTWPGKESKYKNVYLTPDKGAYWKKWISLYNEKMLSKGNLLDLYNLGYDTPEGYAIEKDGSMYYAFYAPEKPSAAHGTYGPSGSSGSGDWTGSIELRGLQPKRYRVTDYVNSKDYGVVTGPVGTINARFADNLLLQVAPETGAQGGR